MKNFRFYKRLFLLSIILASVVFLNNCRKDEYNTSDDAQINQGCTATNALNLSTGIGTDGNLLAPVSGVIDPFWKLLNNPPLVSCTSPLTSSINGSAYVVNFANATNTGWVNQATTSTLAPMNLGTTNSFGCNNATNANGTRVPYIFERSFCVLKNTSIDFNFTFRGDDQIYFELIDNLTSTVKSTSSTYTFPAATASWTTSSLTLSAGSYSIRAYLINTSNVVTGFSFAGSLTTHAGDSSISNNVDGCCENNTISILNILDENCDKIYDNVDQVGSGYTFNVKNSSGTTVATGVTDVNGNVFFSGLPNGTYVVSIVPQAAWSPSSPTGGTTTVTLTNNTVRIIEFYNCT